MGPDIYVLGLSLSLRLNMYNFRFIAVVSIEQNSERRTKFQITADTLMTFARDFFLP